MYVINFLSVAVWEQVGDYTHRQTIATKFEAFQLIKFARKRYVLCIIIRYFMLIV